MDNVSINRLKPAFLEAVHEDFATLEPKETSASASKPPQISSVVILLLTSPFPFQHILEESVVLHNVLASKAHDTRTRGALKIAKMFSYMGLRTTLINIL